MAALDGIQLTLDQLDPAFAAGAVAGAGGINGHIAAAGQLQQIITGVTFKNNRGRALDLEGNLHGICSFRERLMEIQDIRYKIGNDYLISYILYLISRVGADFRPPRNKLT